MFTWKKSKDKCRTPNGRFCEMAAVPPQTILCEIERLSPAGGLVKPPPRKAAGTLWASWKTAPTTGRKNGEAESRKWRHDEKLYLYVSVF